MLGKTFERRMSIGNHRVLLRIGVPHGVPATHPLRNRLHFLKGILVQTRHVLVPDVDPKPQRVARSQRSNGVTETYF